ncbi:hypothetical protein DICPUDRAFT_146763 [Dictyostelium purpureum]|uniref:Mannose-P-dolichol utilization defect 1 protein homolog n=1 Tax=Dictyostelium purpureum TaxID=5786 RepID=F0Z6P2_DICPU|nr:uncharacterized protein DICPUDRAFT_146763 [Dictyostelium purpureum]EGC40394.1 hypothetical protein DICPUDRAFT_146763 [Dictyostelium purpureum]|eukprot:XP_003283145.1 hypothetical protein DICPUDRAFT_146763 [Dictyostelium purpureum]
MEAITKHADAIIQSTLGPQWNLGLLISKALGYGIITGSLLLKVPQILKVMSSKSAESLSASSIAMENIGFTISLLAGYLLNTPFSTYGESAFILIQNIILLVLILKLTGKLGATFVLGSVGYLGFIVGVMKFASPKELNLLLVTIEQHQYNKIPQIVTLLKNKSVGQLSFITVFLNFAGSLARVFTTLKEVNNPTILASYLIGSFLNGVVLTLFFLYWNKKVPARQQVKQKAN